MYLTLENLSDRNNEEIDFHNSQFVDLQFISIDSNTRIYYKVDESIEFAVLEFNQSLQSDDCWTDPTSELLVDANFFGIICFDGIRHAYVPYWHYLNENTLIKILQELNGLAKRNIENYTEA